MSTSQTNNTNQNAQAHPFYLQPCDVKISSTNTSDHGIHVSFDSGEDHLFPWFWVRDHGIDQDSLDHVTLQRSVDTFNLPKDIRCESISLDESGQLLSVLWQDGVTSSISSYMFASVVGQSVTRHALAGPKQQILWDRDSMLEQIPVVQFDSVMGSDEGLRDWLENIHIYGFSLLEGVPSTEQATTELAKRVGAIQETLFGTMWPLSSELTDHGDSAYTTQYLEPHTDGTYYHDAPGLQMFNCFQFDGKGGESIQLDGFAIAARIEKEDPEAYQTLCEIIVPGHYIEPGVHVRAERPAFRLDASGQLVQVSFNNYDRAPFLPAEQDFERFHHAYNLFHQHTIDQRNWIKIPLTPGKTLIFDNWRNLHGRMGYVGKRVFYGCYHSRAEYESKLRVLQASKV